jgi:hypothetical protein
MRRLVANLFVLVVMLTLAGNAIAGGVVYSGTKGFEKLHKGLVQIGFDNIMLVNYRSSTEDATEETTSILNASWMGGITPRYLLMNNLSIGLSLNYFYQLAKTTTEKGGAESVIEASDTGFIGFLTANYHVRLGHSLFIRPGVGVGYFMGTREVPVGSVTVNLGSEADVGAVSIKKESSLSGLAAQIDLTLEYFASKHFSMRAGPIVMVRFGTEKVEGVDEGDSYTQIDAGFIGGLGYSF